MWESFIIHQVFYSLFTLVWQHPSFQLTNSLVSYDRIINQSFNAQVKFKQLWCSLVSLWSLMHSVTIPTQWMDYTWNYALKSALLPHANTQSPDVTEYNWSLWSLCMFLWTSITNPYAIYISPVGDSATMLDQSKNCSSL